MFFSYENPVYVVSKSTGSYVDGKWTGETEAGPYTLSDASIQPAKYTDIESLPEGRRKSSSLRLYTSETLKTHEENQNPDIVEIDSIRYEVYALKKWGNSIIPHKIYLLIEEV